ncbi:MAG: hypothetical protein JY451_10380 [Erythrobacter sp.]|nr:MAG: hypothetical protein JY451_10380 [Erythrobacter sp.]
MAHEWIKAPLASHYVADGPFDYDSRKRICERAHAGLIAAKAEVVIWQGQVERDRLLPKNFWWAEGHEALEQDWDAGDFSTWIDEKIEVKAFGVSFDFLALSELIPADRQAIALRAISVLGEENWISSRELLQLMYASQRSVRQSAELLEACRLGSVAGRAMRAVGEGKPDHYGNKSNGWTAMEWDIPLWFWRSFTDSASSNCDWQLGTVKGRGNGPNGRDFIQLQGVHFHKSGLINLGLADTLPDDASPASKRGRKPEYDWPAANNAIWGKINRGELIPQNQAQIEVAFQALLRKGEKEPSESTVRPYASRIWEEYSKA